jgi:hypothetical protein
MPSLVIIVKQWSTGTKVYLPMPSLIIIVKQWSTGTKVYLPMPSLVIIVKQWSTGTESLLTNAIFSHLYALDIILYNMVLISSEKPFKR